MIAALFNNSNRNCGAEMGVGGAERIDYNLISRLLLVSDPLLLFGFCFW